MSVNVQRVASLFVASSGSGSGDLKGATPPPPKVPLLVVLTGVDSSTGGRDTGGATGGGVI
jgi:hypothetical protein